jgi:hypothetical protein
MILIGVLVVFLIFNILSGDVFNGITNLIILSIASGTLLQRLRGQARQKEGE